MVSLKTDETDLLLLSAARLTLARIKALPGLVGAWGWADATLVRSDAGRQLTRQADAAAMLGNAAVHLTKGIALIPCLELGGRFRPVWAGLQRDTVMAYLAKDLVKPASVNNLGHKACIHPIAVIQPHDVAH